jgi:hypothetical protein
MADRQSVSLATLQGGAVADLSSQRMEDDNPLGPTYAARVPEPHAVRPKHQRRGKRRCESCHGRGQLYGMTKTAGSGLTAGSGACPDCDGVGWIGEQHDA